MTAEKREAAQPQRGRVKRLFSLPTTFCGCRDSATNAPLQAADRAVCLYKERNEITKKELIRPWPERRSTKGVHPRTTNKTPNVSRKDSKITSFRQRIRFPTHLSGSSHAEATLASRANVGILFNSCEYHRWMDGSQQGNERSKQEIDNE